MSKISTVYLAGRIDGIGREEATNWRNEAIDKLSAVGKIGICPIKHGVEFDGNNIFNMERQINIFKVDIDLIRKSDAMLVNHEKLSFGTAQEMFFADQVMNIPVFVFNNQSTNSAFFHATTFSVSESLDDAISEIVRFSEFSKLKDIVELRPNHYQIPHINKHPLGTKFLPVPK